MYTWLILCQLSMLLALPSFMDSPDDDSLQVRYFYEKSRL